jgi:hypothetical protein
VVGVFRSLRERGYRLPGIRLQPCTRARRSKAGFHQLYVDDPDRNTLQFRSGRASAHALSPAAVFRARQVPSRSASTPPVECIKTACRSLRSPSASRSRISSVHRAMPFTRARIVRRTVDRQVQRVLELEKDDFRFDPGYRIFRAIGPTILHSSRSCGRPDAA